MRSARPATASGESIDQRVQFEESTVEKNITPYGRGGGACARANRYVRKSASYPKLNCAASIDDFDPRWDAVSSLWGRRLNAKVRTDVGVRGSWFVALGGMRHSRGGSVSERAISLAYDETKTKFSEDGNGFVRIPVCFKSDGVNPYPPAATVAWIRDAVLNSWNVVSNVRFEEFIACPNDILCSKKYVVVALRELPGEGQGSAQLGLDALVCPTETATVYLKVSSSELTRRRIEYLAVHEFGHVLGFDHEHERQGSPVCRQKPDAAPELQDPNAKGITAYDQDSIMNYCNSEGNGSGMMTDLDILGVQTFYKKNPLPDADRDGILDISDNCPYVSNAEQLDSNFEAEWAVTMAANPGLPSTEGHVPTTSDSQTYIDHWHATYKGDACDPTPVARAKFEPDNQFGGIACSGSTPGAKYVSFEGYKSSSTGTRKPGNATANAAFCHCDLQPVAGQNLAIACMNSQSWLCTVGDDSVFPTAGPPTKYLTMSTCGTPTAIAPVTSTVPPAAAWGYVPNSTAAQVWNSGYDAPRFNVTPGSLRGVAWTHATNYVSGISPPPFPQTNLNNNYQAVSDKTWTLPFNPATLCVGCQFPWWTVSWRDVWTPPIFELGTSPTNTRVPIFQTADAIKQATPLFTTEALGALQLASTEIVPSLENSSGSIRGRVSVTGVLINANTGYLRGAFSVAPDERVDYRGASGNSDENVSTPVRLFVASEGSSGTLYSLRGSNVIKQDVAATLALVPTRTTTAMTGDVPFNPQAGAWDKHTRRLYVLDLIGTPATKQMRLVVVQENGVAKKLWQSPPAALTTMPTKYFVQTSTSGDAMISVSFSASSEWTLVDSTGTAKSAGTWPNPLVAAPFISDSAIAAPFQRVGGTQQQGPIRIVSTERARLAAGACTTTWFKNFVPSVPCGDAWNGVQPTGDTAALCQNL